PLARRFLGEPNQRLSRANELRFGNNGSLCVDIKLGRWFDFEEKKGGGVLDLVKREIMVRSDREAFEWLEREGYWKNGKGGDSSNVKWVTVESFEYRDRDGALSFVVDRIEFQKPDGSFVIEDGKRKKTFIRRRPDPDHPGKWIKNVDGCP